MLLGLRLSPAFGGVNKFPTLAMLPEGAAVCPLLRVLEYGWYLLCKAASGGGGSSKDGRLCAADLLAVKLEAPIVSAGRCMSVSCLVQGLTRCTAVASRLSVVNVDVYWTSITQAILNDLIIVLCDDDDSDRRSMQ